MLFPEVLDHNSPQAPGELERQEILTTLVRDMHVAPDVSLEDYAIQTAALVPCDLVDLVSRSRYAYLKRAMRTR